ncbi:MAG: HEAT repeat domain-containing protein [Polyangiaceae bacterium]|nr:HEAT repeat domain-containing protein [Polyangiaceae bacterium]
MRGVAALAILAALHPLATAHSLTWPDVADRVERDLSAGDVATRRSAARALASLGPKRGAPLALTAMSDSDGEVRILSAEAAMRFRTSAATDVATAWLNAPDPRLRREACEVARALPSPRAIAPLARSLGDPDAEVRAAAAEALGHQGSPEVVAPLLGRLDDGTPAVRIAIVGALARIGDARAVVPLVGKVEDSAADVRQSVVRALGDLGDARASSALVLALRDQNTEVRREALVALGRLRASEAVDSIAPFVSDHMASLRMAALDALGRIATPDALRAAATTLGTGDDGSDAFGATPVRDALVAAGAPAAALMRALLAGSPSPLAATSAAWVLGELQARSEAPALVAAMRRGVLPTAAALHALAGAGTPAEVPVVLEFVDDPSPVVRGEAIDAAAALLDPNEPDGRAVEPLAAALRDARPSNEERARLARVLGRTGAPRAATVLAQLVKAQDARLRIAAIDALGTLGPLGDADGPLLEASASPDGEVRLHAAVALGEAGTARARDALLAHLDGADEIDRPALFTALGGVLSRAPSEAAVAHLAGAYALAAGPERDGILDALGRAPLASAVAALGTAAQSTEPLDRSAAARMCAAHAAKLDPAGSGAALGLVRTLLADPDERVRRQAAWSLGALGTSDDVPALAAAARGDDADTASNATAALGRILARAQAPGATSRELCPLLSSPQVLVRANALAGLSLGDARCDGGTAERRALSSDPAETVRAAAARAVALSAEHRAGAPAAGSDEDTRALETCARADASSVVARRCAETPSRPARVHATLVYVVPVGADTPRPGAAYAMLLADGLVHAGTADRRGAVFDPVAPEGQLRLIPPGGVSR